jgi:hypothetical protein
MTKLRELAIKDFDDFNSIEMAKIYDFMQVIKDKKHIKTTKKDTSYLKVREALQGCPESLSEDILREREEAL